TYRVPSKSRNSTVEGGRDTRSIVGRTTGRRWGRYGRVGRDATEGWAMAGTERRSVRVTVGVIAAGAGAAMIVSSFLTWVSTPAETGGRTRVSGWGAISGASDIAGT